MKINQLFVRPVDVEMLNMILQCFNLQDATDKRMFCKSDMVEYKTVERLKDIKHIISSFYIPCKAKLYLSDLTEKKAITLLKQVLRLHGLSLISKEKNSKNKKIIYYQIVNENDLLEPYCMRRRLAHNVIIFNG
jgi:hypothetical protein